MTDNVFFFGDSICFGQFVSLHKTWVVRLSAAVEREFGPRFVVMNSSRNGETTRMALERLDYDVESHGLALMVLQFGLNDCNYWASDKGRARVDHEEFRANLLEIVDRASAAGARRILLDTNHPTPRTDPFPYADTTYQESNERYNEAIRGVAGERTQVVLVDVDAGFREALARGAALEELLLADGLHLSERGHDLYAEIVGPVLLRTLAEIDGRAATAASTAGTFSAGE